ncbi:MAG TPA: 50S ribosomal protein L21 [Rhizomicrobium sp.]|nr:50S ribosomal protein L21 [Rhizomicrobium sp.]
MYAVVRTGGKQYRVAKDSVLKVESLAGDVGAKLTLGEVLMLGGDKPKLGAPLVEGASVECEILEHGQGEKVIAFKKKRRKNTHRKRGHRQHFTKVKVLSISAGKE